MKLVQALHQRDGQYSWVNGQSSDLLTRLNATDHEHGGTGRIPTGPRQTAHRQRIMFLVCHSGALSSLARNIALQLVCLGEERGWLVSADLAPQT
jgi:hypothetical protein